MFETPLRLQGLLPVAGPTGLMAATAGVAAAATGGVSAGAGVVVAGTAVVVVVGVDAGVGVSATSARETVVGFGTGAGAATGRGRGAGETTGGRVALLFEGRSPMANTCELASSNTEVTMRFLRLKGFIEDVLKLVIFVSYQDFLKNEKNHLRHRSIFIFKIVKLSSFAFRAIRASHKVS